VRIIVELIVFTRRSGYTGVMIGLAADRLILSYAIYVVTRSLFGALELVSNSNTRSIAVFIRSYKRHRLHTLHTSIIEECLLIEIARDVSRGLYS